MTYRCGVRGCDNTNDRYASKGTYYDGKYLIFPRDPVKLQQWNQLIGCNTQTKKFICSEHFANDAWRVQDVIMNVPMAKRKIKPDAVPSLKLPTAAAAAHNDEDSIKVDQVLKQPIEENEKKIKEETQQEQEEKQAMDEATRKRLVAEALEAYEESQLIQIRAAKRQTKRSQRLLKKAQNTIPPDEEPLIDVEMQTNDCSLDQHSTRKCGEITMDIDDDTFALNCTHCEAIYWDLLSFAEHVRSQHVHSLLYTCENPLELSNTNEEMHLSQPSSVLQENVSCVKLKLEPAELKSDNRELVLQLIHLLKQNPMIWQQQHPLHGNYRKRRIVIVSMIKSLSKSFPEQKFTHRNVGLLLSRLRAEFHNEQKLKKIAAEKGLLHKNRVWYYEKLLFLDEENETHSEPPVTIMETRIYTCEDCGKRCASAAKLQNHRRMHTNERPYMCATCGKTFRNYTTWFRHGRTHTKVKPFQCELCKHAYYTAGLLRLHQKMHLGIRDKMCDICGKSFTNAKLLYGHRRIHRTESQHVRCSCGKRFKRHSANLQAHRKRCVGQAADGEQQQSVLDTVGSKLQTATNQVTTIVKVEDYTWTTTL